MRFKVYQSLNGSEKKCVNRTDNDTPQENYSFRNIFQCVVIATVLFRLLPSPRNLFLWDLEERESCEPEETRSLGYLVRSLRKGQGFLIKSSYMLICGGLLEEWLSFYGRRLERIVCIMSDVASDLRLFLCPIFSIGSFGNSIMIDLIVNTAF